MSGAAPFAAPPPEITTKAELDQLTETRPEPAPAPHLTPDGPDAVAVKEQVAVSEERRIVELQERLTQMREGVDRDFTFAGLEGRAKVDFERSR